MYTFISELLNLINFLCCFSGIEKLLNKQNKTNFSSSETMLTLFKNRSKFEPISDVAIDATII